MFWNLTKSIFKWLKCEKGVSQVVFVLIEYHWKVPLANRYFFERRTKKKDSQESPLKLMNGNREVINVTICYLYWCFLFFRPHRIISQWFILEDNSIWRCAGKVSSSCSFKKKKQKKPLSVQGGRGGLGHKVEVRNDRQLPEGGLSGLQQQTCWFPLQLVHWGPPV